MSKWTKFRIIINCLDSEDQIREILGEPIPEVTDENLNDDQFWFEANEKCHLAKGSEGSLHYAIFESGSSFIVVIIGCLRDYTPDEGKVWYKETMQKFKYASSEVVIIEEG